MRVLIFGSRGWHDPFPMDAMIAGLDVLSEGADEKLVVIHGDAPGADRLAKKLARRWGAEVIDEPAEWDRYGKSAGPRRNQKMLDEHAPEVAIAYRSKGKSNGTDDMIEKALAAEVPTYVVEEAVSKEARLQAVEEALEKFGVDLGESSYYGVRRRELAEACIEAYRSA